MIYISRLIAEKDKYGVPSFKLKKDEDFNQTEQLDGEHGALKDFISEFGSQKGLHIAVICSDDINLEKVLDLFTHKNLDCQVSNCTYCTEKKAFRISEIESAHPKLSFPHKYYQEGCYWECISLSSPQLSILDLFQEIIDCLSKLDKDNKNASDKLTSMQMLCKCFQTTNIHNFLTPEMMSEFSDSILSETDVSGQCANICILFLLPMACFDIFKCENFCFPPQIEYVIQGINKSEYLKTYFDKISWPLHKMQQYVDNYHKGDDELAILIGSERHLKSIVENLGDLNGIGIFKLNLNLSYNNKDYLSSKEITNDKFESLDSRKNRDDKGRE